MQTGLKPPWNSRASCPATFQTFTTLLLHLPGGLVVRIRRSHRRGPGSIPGQGTRFDKLQPSISNATGFTLLKAIKRSKIATSFEPDLNQRPKDFC